MHRSVENLHFLAKRRDDAAAEYTAACVSAQRLPILELIESAQETGLSFEEATRAILESVVEQMLGACRSYSEISDEIFVMKEIMDRLIASHGDV